jgi:hypothetical protein
VPFPAIGGTLDVVSQDGQHEHVVRQWAADDRLTPWVVYDLERIAWVIELRAADLTDQESQIVRAAAGRMLDALDEASDTTR